MRRRSATTGSALVSPTDRLLLLAAIGDRDTASAAWRAWCARDKASDPSGDSTRLLAAVEHNLGRHGIESDRARRAAGARRHAFYRTTLLLRHGLHAVRELEERGFEPLLLKGAAIVARYAPTPSVRPMNDVDVLVPRSTVREAMAALQMLGWRSTVGEPVALIPVRHSTPFTKDGVQVDLHWDVMPESRALPERWAYTGAVNVELMGTRTRVLNLTAQLFHTIAHGLRHSKNHAVWWPIDAHYLQQHEDEIDGDRLLELALAHDLTEPLAIGIRCFVALSGAGIDPALVHRLERSPVSVLTRLETHFRLHGSKPAGDLPMHLFDFRRYRRNGSPGSLPLSFPAYLARVWQLESTGDLPRAALGKARVKLMRLLVAEATAPDAGWGGTHSPHTSRTHD